VVGELVRGRYGFSWAFATAGVGMTFSLIIFSLFRHHLKVADTRSSVAAVLDIPLPADYEDPRDPPAVERQRITALIIMCAIVMVFWMAFHQNGSTLSLWARDNTNRVITLYDRHLQPYPFTIPPGWFAAVNSFFILTFTPVLVWLFRRLRAVRLEPSTPAKIGLGMLLTGASYLLMVGGALAGGNHGKVSLWWLVGCYFVITIAELLLSPMGLSMVTKLAPRRMTAMMMGLWFISTSIGNKLAGELGKLWEKWPHSRFFALLVAASFFAALVLATQFRRLRAAMPPEGPAPDTRPSELSSSDSPEPSPAMDSAATALH
jgi:POT family proton-dependent oligopeptide transporter